MAFAPAGVINRFPICAAWYMVVAKQLGYSEAQAQSLGNARATFFAAAKNGFKGAGKSKGRAPKGSGSFPTKASAKVVAPSNINFCGLDTTVNSKGYAIFGGQTFTPEMYKSGVEKKFEMRVGAKGYKHLISKMEELARRYGKNLDGQLAYQVYSEIRDSFRTKEFYGL
jgi:hypothetical protein